MDGTALNARPPRPPGRGRRIIGVAQAISTNITVRIRNTSEKLIRSPCIRTVFIIA